MNQLDKLTESLISRIYSTKELGYVSTVLEQLASNEELKQHAYELVTDENLTDRQKKTQMQKLFQNIEVPVLQEFFDDIFNRNQFWLFESENFDYFDDFVRNFQMKIEHVGIVYLVTAVELKERDVLQIADALSEILGKHVVISQQLNPGIIGGIQIRIENLVFDYSIKAKFQQFQTKWIASLQESSELVTLKN